MSLEKLIKKIEGKIINKNSQKKLKTKIINNRKFNISDL